MKRGLAAAALCLALLLTALPAGAAAGDMRIDAASAVLGRGAVLAQNTYWTGDDYRAEHYVILSPQAALRPVVYSAETLCAAESMYGAAAALEARGLHAAAGINGGFYTLATGVPVGMVAGDGILRSDPQGLEAVGFRADGSAVIGDPGLRLALAAGDTVLDVATLNRPREGGLALFTADFAADTKSAGDGWNVVCVPDGPVPLSGNVGLTVERIAAESGAAALPEGRVVLSLAGDTAGGEMPAWLAALAPGDVLALDVSCAEGWEDVKSAVGLLYPLLEDGAPVAGLAQYAAAAPRSAVGLRADGTLVFYTVDGRQSGYSVGAGLDAVAQRMKELGCVRAGALDGGASTNLCAVLPGDDALSQINRPSGLLPRDVVNYIFLVTEAGPAGTAARLALYPLDIDAVEGAEIPLTVKAVDANGYPAPVPEDVAFAVSGDLGSVENGVFTARQGGSGTVTVSAPGLESASIPVTVVTSPDQILLYGEVYGRLTSSLTLAPGQEVDLTVRAMSDHLLLTGSDECYTWTLDPDAGDVDTTGHITPAAVSGSGTLTVSAGTTARRIPITVWSGVPFRDVLTTDPYFPAVRYVYEHQIFNGTSETAFEPETVMNRAMLVTVLWRMNGEPAAETGAAFADVPPEEWYGPAVAWAVERGLVNGYGDGRFGPLDALTKEQILTILWRYAGAPEPRDGADTVTDADGVDGYARAAMEWALRPEPGLIERGTDGLLPREPMTRAAVAEVLTRYLTQT